MVAVGIVCTIMLSNVASACYLASQTVYTDSSCTQATTAYDWGAFDFDQCSIGVAACEFCTMYGYSPWPSCVESEAKWYPAGSSGQNGFICKVRWDVGLGSCNGEFEGKWDVSGQKCANCDHDGIAIGYFGCEGAYGNWYDESISICESACGAEQACDGVYPGSTSSKCGPDGPICLDTYDKTCHCGCRSVNDCPDCAPGLIKKCTSLKCGCSSECSIDAECGASYCCTKVAGASEGTCVAQGEIYNSKYLCKASSPAQWHVCDESTDGVTYEIESVSYTCLSENGDYMWVKEESQDLLSVIIQFLKNLFSIYP